MKPAAWCPQTADLPLRSTPKCNRRGTPSPSRNLYASITIWIRQNQTSLVHPVRKLLIPIMMALAVAAAVAQTPDAPTPDSTAAPLPGLPGPGLKPATTNLNYQISPADILQITVFQEEDLKSLLRVSNDGAITFPLIGVVPVKGLSAPEAAQAIATRLAKGYLLNPQVTVTVMEFSKRRFTVLGSVQKPGSYDMPDQEDTTLLQAIGIAGGYTRIADARKVTLMRKTSGKPEVFHINAKKMAAGTGEPMFNILPGDVITVPESMF
jgi:protein involved in polysaccharide export with SLBB domain